MGNEMKGDWWIQPFGGSILENRLLDTDYSDSMFGGS